MRTVIVAAIIAAVPFSTIAQNPAAQKGSFRAARIIDNARRQGGSANQAPPMPSTKSPSALARPTELADFKRRFGDPSTDTTQGAKRTLFYEDERLAVEFTLDARGEWKLTGYFSRANKVAKRISVSDAAEIMKGRDSAIVDPEEIKKADESRKALKREKEAAKQTAKDYATADSHLRFAKKLIDQGDKAKAIDRLKNIIEKYPGSPAAMDAKKILDKLKP